MRAQEWINRNCRFAIAMPASKYEAALGTLATEAHQARMRLKTQHPQMSDFVSIAAEMIGRHGVTYEQFIDRMTKEFGLHHLKLAQVAAPAEVLPQQVVNQPHNLEQIYTQGRRRFQQAVPNQQAVDTAKQYTASIGLPEPKPHEYARVDNAQAKRIADAYEAMPDNPLDPATQQAYLALRTEVNAQFAKLPVKVEPFSGTGNLGGAYRNSREMMQDVMDNKHLWVFSGGEANSLLSPEDNFKLRAIHDYFGHAQFGYEFGPRGEENAWIEHSKMFSPLARKALTTETRGQNNWVNHGPHSHLPASQRPYAQQKAGLLPEEFHTHPALG